MSKTQKQAFVSKNAPEYTAYELSFYHGVHKANRMLVQIGCCYSRPQLNPFDRTRTLVHQHGRRCDVGRRA
jgi:hypothetical protein